MRTVEKADRAFPKSGRLLRLLRTLRLLNTITEQVAGRKLRGVDQPAHDRLARRRVEAEAVLQCHDMLLDLEQRGEERVHAEHLAVLARRLVVDIRLLAGEPLLDRHPAGEIDGPAAEGIGIGGADIARRVQRLAGAGENLPFLG